MNRQNALSAQQVLAVTLFSDELFVAGQPWTRGSAVYGKGDLEGVTESWKIEAPWDTRTFSFCNEGDYYCTDRKLAGLSPSTVRVFEK